MTTVTLSWDEFYPYPCCSEADEHKLTSEYWKDKIYDIPEEDFKRWAKHEEDTHDWCLYFEKLETERKSKLSAEQLRKAKEKQIEKILTEGYNF